MESSQYDQASSADAGGPGEDDRAGLLELVAHRSESAVTGPPASQRPARRCRSGAAAGGDDPLGRTAFVGSGRALLPRPQRPPAALKDDLINLLSRDVAELDRCLSEQVDAVLHHPRFQALEAAWRGLELLIDGDRRAREPQDQGLAPAQGPVGRRPARGHRIRPERVLPESLRGRVRDGRRRTLRGADRATTNSATVPATSTCCPRSRRWPRRPSPLSLRASIR